MKKIFFLLLFAFTIVNINSVQATHEMGGLITWDCLQNGQYVFRFQFYRDCSGTGYPPTLNLTVYNHPSINSIPVNLIQTIDRSTPCDSCSGALPGRVEEFIYESAPTVLTGVPGPQGWTFAYNVCCRNPNIGNLSNPSIQSYSYRANMYSYNGQPADPCYDSSPRFVEKPDFVLCTSVISQELNNVSVDPELDSLVYEWAAAFDQFNTSVVYAAGYASNSPFPDSSIDTNNVAATLDSQTGQVKFTSFTAGRFVSVVCVRAYKCGQLLSEIFREINTDLVNGCMLQGSGLQNFPPIVTAPFPDSTGAFTLYEKVYVAGDTIDFFMSATDTDWDPAVGGLQTVTMNGFSNQFIDSLIFPQMGCFMPPCATSMPPLPVSAPFGTGASIEWITTCDHFVDSICIDTINYPFSIIAFDNYCPVPASNNNIVTIKLINPDAIAVEPPTITGAQIYLNLSVGLDWIIPSDPYGLFEQYLIYYTNNLGSPWVLLDSIKNYNQSIYNHAGPVNLGLNHYYQIITQTRSCRFGFNLSDSSNIITAIFPGINENNNLSVFMHPNPANKIVYLNFSENHIGNLYIEILDALGRKVKAQQFSSTRQSYPLTINDLDNGIYYLHIESKKGKAVLKLLKNNNN